MLKVCDSVMTQLSRIVDLYFNYDSIVVSHRGVLLT